jgi:hypothetical protein
MPAQVVPRAAAVTGTLTTGIERVHWWLALSHHGSPGGEVIETFAAANTVESTLGVC